MNKKNFKKPGDKHKELLDQLGVLTYERYRKQCKYCGKFNSYKMQKVHIDRDFFLLFLESMDRGFMSFQKHMEKGIRRKVPRDKVQDQDPVPPDISIQ